VPMISAVVAISTVAMVLDYRRERRRDLNRITVSLEEQASALQAAHVLFIYLAVAYWVIGPLEELAHAAQRWTARCFSAR